MDMEKIKPNYDVEEINEYLFIQLDTVELYDRLAQMNDEELKFIEIYLKRIEFAKNDIEAEIQTVNDQREINVFDENSEIDLSDDVFRNIDNKIKSLMALRQFLVQFDMYRDMLNDLILTADEYRKK